MLRDKAMIIIAVSEYEGTFPDLPGAVVSAQRLRQWAENTDEDRNYKVLYLGDDERGPITTRLLIDEIVPFVSNQAIDRLVVYFAGHGLVRSAGDQFWLLTRAANSTREGINVEAFRRGLLKYNIGKHNDDVSGQICIIGDACRNTSRDSIDFCGDPILDSTEEKDTSIQLDRFLSTELGEASYEITDNSGSYCLFTEVLLGALDGKAEEVIEREHHRFKPAVVNTKLADYLVSQIPTRASDQGVDMEPDVSTGIRPDFNFYRQFAIPLPLVNADTEEPELAAAVRMGLSDRRDGDLLQGSARLNAASIRNLQRPPELHEFADVFGCYRYDVDLKAESPYAFVFCDYEPEAVAAPGCADVRIQPRGQRHYEVRATNCFGSPLLVLQEGRWVIAPHYPNVLATLLLGLPGDALIFRPDSLIWDTYLSDFVNLVPGAPLRVADAQHFADAIRCGKERYPHQSVNAGYLYEFANDYDNVARTAHYMWQNTEIVPFDLALLCTQRIRWRREGALIVAFADLPAVQKVEPDDEDDRPYYARSAFGPKREVKLWGIAPIYSQGWSFFKTEKYLAIPKEIRAICDEVAGRSAANLTNKGLELFLEAFDYQITETDHR